VELLVSTQEVFKEAADCRCPLERADLRSPIGGIWDTEVFYRVEVTAIDRLPDAVHKLDQVGGRGLFGHRPASIPQGRPFGCCTHERDGSGASPRGWPLPVPVGEEGPQGRQPRASLPRSHLAACARVASVSRFSRARQRLLSGLHVRCSPLPGRSRSRAALWRRGRVPADKPRVATPCRTRRLRGHSPGCRGDEAPGQHANARCRVAFRRTSGSGPPRGHRTPGDSRKSRRPSPFHARKPA